MSNQKLYAALIAAQREAQTVPKDGKNDHFGFSYTKADTMYRHGKALLNRHGLALMPLGLTTSHHVAPTSVIDAGVRKIADMLEYDVTRAFKLVHESGGSEEFTFTWPVDLAGGKKSRDKSVAAADTTLLSYAYRDLLALGRLGEGEVDALTPLVRDERGVDRKAGKVEIRPLGEHTAASSHAEREALAAAQELAELAKAEAALGWESKIEDAAERKAIQDLAKEEEVEHAQKVLETVPLGADDFESRGWEPEIAEEIAAIDDTDPVARAVVNHLAKLCTFAHGIKGAAAKKRLTEDYAKVGVDIKIKQTPTGTQLKQWAMSALLPF
jgi:hypothetical protein